MAIAHCISYLTHDLSCPFRATSRGQDEDIRACYKVSN